MDKSEKQLRKETMIKAAEAAAAHEPVAKWFIHERSTPGAPTAVADIDKTMDKSEQYRLIIADITVIKRDIAALQRLVAHAVQRLNKLAPEQITEQFDSIDEIIAAAEQMTDPIILVADGTQPDSEYLGNTTHYMLLRDQDQLDEYYKATEAHFGGDPDNPANEDGPSFDHMFWSQYKQMDLAEFKQYAEQMRE